MPPPPSFGSPQLSTDQVYYRDAGCGPGNVTFSIEAEHPAGVKSVVLFRRLHEIGGSQDSGWSAVDSMDPVGGNTYSLSVSGNSLVAGTGFESSAQVSYQFVIEPQNGEFVRSTVYQDLSLAPCYISTDTPTPSPTPTEFTPEPIGSINGGAWIDDNENGFFDSGEYGYSGITVTLRAGTCFSSVIVDLTTTQTDSTGRFAFSYVSPGDYCVVVPSSTCYYEATSVSQSVRLGLGEDKSISWFSYIPAICVR